MTDNQCAQKGNNLIVYAITFTACLNIVSMGSIVGWPMAALPKLYSSNSTIIITRDEGAWVASVKFLGTTIGSIVTGLTINKLGVKRTMMVSVIPSLTGWTILGIATTYWELLLGRLTLGCVSSIGYTATAIYLCELADARIRGRIGSMVSYSLNIGILLSFTIGPYFSLSLTAWLNLIPPIIFILMIVLAPESPYWYSKRKMFEEMRKSLICLRRTKNVQEEFDNIKSHTENDTSFENRMCTWRSMRFMFPRCVNCKGLYFALFMITVQQFSGVQAIITYGALIFEKTTSIIEGRYVAMLIGFIELCCTVISSLVIDSIGRKPLSIISTIGCASCMAILGIYFHLNSIGIDMASIQLLPVCVILLFATFYGLGLSSMAMVMISEYVPMEIRATGVMLSIWLYCFVATMVTKLWQVLSDGFGVQCAFGAVSFITYTNAVILFIFMQETRGKTLGEIQKILAEGRNGGVRNEHVIPLKEINSCSEQSAMLDSVNNNE